MSSASRHTLLRSESGGSAVLVHWMIFVAGLGVASSFHCLVWPSGTGSRSGRGRQRPWTGTLNSQWPHLPVEPDFMPPGENNAVSVDRPFQCY